MNYTPLQATASGSSEVSRSQVESCVGALRLSKNCGLGYAVRRGIPSSPARVEFSPIDTVRLEKCAIDERVAAAKVAYHERSRKLRAERKRMIGQQGQVHRAWLNVQAAVSHAQRAEKALVDDGVSLAWAEQLRKLQQERSALGHERSRVHELAVAAEQRLGEAVELSKEHVDQWEIHASQQHSAQAHREAILQERFTTEEEATRLRLEQVEKKEEERIQHALEAADERVREVLEVSIRQSREMEVQGANRREAEARREREFSSLQKAREAMAKAHIAEAAMRARSAQVADCGMKMESWKQRAEAEVRLQMLAKVRQFEEIVARTEACASSHNKEEHQRLLECSEALTETRLQQARSQVEQSAKAQVASIREEWRVRVAAWDREFQSMEATRLNAWELQESAANLAREEAMASEVHDHEAACEKACAFETRQLLEERQACRDGLVARRVAHEEASARLLEDAAARHRAACEAAVAAEVSSILREGAEREVAWTQQINAAEALRDQAFLSAQQLEQTGLTLERDYVARLGNLLDEAARLQTETKMLAQQRCEVLGVREKIASGAHAAASLGENSAIGSSASACHVPALCGTKRGFGEDQQSTTASSGAGVTLGVSGNSWHVADWDSAEPAPTARSFASSGLGPSISARGPDSSRAFGMSKRQLHTPDVSVIPLGPGSTPSGSPMGAWPQSVGPFLQGHWGDPIPSVYARALTDIEHHGWNAVHPEGEPPAWTVLHWAADQGKAGICLRLLTARADPLLKDDQGKSALDYARQADGGSDSDAWSILAEAVEDRGCRVGANGSKQPPRLPVLDLVAANAAAASEPQTSSTEIPERPANTLDEIPIPEVYASAIAAVERYGWDTVHGGQAVWTALHWAAEQGLASICARLLECRADPGQPDNLGRSALDYAHEADDEDTLVILLSSMSELDVRGLQ